MRKDWIAYLVFATVFCAGGVAMINVGKADIFECSVVFLMSVLSVVFLFMSLDRKYMEYHHTPPHKIIPMLLCGGVFICQFYEQIIGKVTKFTIISGAEGPLTEWEIPASYGRWLYAFVDFVFIIPAAIIIGKALFSYIKYRKDRRSPK